MEVKNEISLSGGLWDATGTTPHASLKPAHSWTHILRHHIRRQKKHHLAIGAGTVAAVVIAGLVMIIPGKSRKARADVASVVEITAPANFTAQTRTADVASSVESLPALPTIGSIVSRDVPRAEMIVKSLVTIASHDGIPLSSASGIGLYKRGNVMLTKDLAAFAQSLSKYFASNHMEAMITSGVRTGDRQLEIIKDRIAEYGMTRSFPGLSEASVADKNVWTPAWEWLKAHHVPVNPPADYVNEEGSRVGGSLHLKGLAMDVVSDDLDALRDALDEFASTGQSRGLRISGLTRERDCVHISLSK